MGFARGRWTKAHWVWLRAQEFAEPARQFVFKALYDAVLEAEAEARRVEKAMLAELPAWRFAPLVQGLRALRGIDMIGAATLACAIGDPRRFANAASLMAYFGLTPCEHTSGSKRRQGGITKTGDGESRRILVEAASWSRKEVPAEPAEAWPGQAEAHRQPAPEDPRDRQSLSRRGCTNAPGR